ncbi:MAG: transposase [Acidobacteria bacterium]|nr:transposase [Acidobacteriota bacterium]
MAHYVKLKRNPLRYRRKLPHLQLSDWYFVTFTTDERWELTPEARTAVFASCMHEHERTIRIDAVVVMPEHAHMLFHLHSETGAEPLLYEILGAIKGASAHKVNKLLGRSGRVWVAESFDRMVREGEHLRYRNYIIMNPVRRGLVSSPDDYEWLWYEKNQEKT